MGGQLRVTSGLFACAMDYDRWHWQTDAKSRAESSASGSPAARDATGRPRPQRLINMDSFGSIQRRRDSYKLL